MLRDAKDAPGMAMLAEGAEVIFAPLTFGRIDRAPGGNRMVTCVIDLGGERFMLSVITSQSAGIIRDRVKRTDAGEGILAARGKWAGFTAPGDNGESFTPLLGVIEVA